MIARSLLYLLIPLCLLQAQAATLLNGTAAVVGQKIITYQEVEQQLQTLKKRLVGTQTPLPNRTVLYEAALDQLIEKTLLLDWADQHNIHITAHQISQAKKRLSKQMSTEEIKNSLIVTELERALLQEKKAFPTKQSVQHFLEKVGDSNQQYQLLAWKSSTKSQAMKIKKQLTIPDASPSTANELGWQKASELPDAYRKALREKTSDIIGPIHTGNGYHLLKIIDQKGHTLTANQAYGILINQSLRTLWPQWITELKSHAYIRRFSAPT